MAIYIPFNHNPASRDLKTAAYTIPAGQYAFVHFLGYDTACTIGGDTIIPALSVNDTQSLSADTNDFYAPPTGYCFEGRISAYFTTFSSGDASRWGLRTGATDYWNLGLRATSTTAISAYNFFSIGQNTVNVSAIGNTDAMGQGAWTVPSGTTSCYHELAGGSQVVRVHVFGTLRSPIGMQTWFHVPTGVEVVSSSFEVILFNEA